MTGDAGDRHRETAAKRQEARLAAALRLNLRRRKDQSRSRDTADTPAEEAKAAGPSTPELM